jgi:hypothetical protein
MWLTGFCLVLFVLLILRGIDKALRKNEEAVARITGGYANVVSMVKANEDGMHETRVRLVKLEEHYKAKLEKKIAKKLKKHRNKCGAV